MFYKQLCNNEIYTMRAAGFAYEASSIPGISSCFVMTKLSQIVE